MVTSGLIVIFKHFTIVDHEMTSSGQQMAFEGFNFYFFQI